MRCGSCNFYCLDRRICIFDGKFYFESFPSCEKYKKAKEFDDVRVDYYIGSEVENLLIEDKDSN